MTALKRLPLVAALGLFAALLASCGGGSSSPGAAEASGPAVAAVWDESGKTWDNVNWQ